MTVKEVVIDALATKPCRALLTLLENNRIGTIALNQVSYPRCVFKSFEEGWRAAKRVSYAGRDHPDYLRFQLDWLERCVLSFSFTGMRFTFVTVQY